MKKKAGPERVAFLSQLAHCVDQPALAHLYGMTMAAVARKSVIRLDRETKSRFCKKCYIPRTVWTTEWRIEDLSKLKIRPTLVIKCKCGSEIRRPLYDLKAKENST